MKYLKQLKILQVNSEYKAPVGGVAREPGQIAAIFKGLKYHIKEWVYVLYIGEGLMINSFDVHSVGNSSTSIVTPNELFRSAILTKTNSFILLHNHPSGSTIPSKSDELLIKILKEQSEVLNFNFLDFIIIGDDEYWSMHEKEIGTNYIEKE